MISKVLTFGLGALALVRAAPAAFSFQTPMLSCSVKMGTVRAVVHFYDDNAAELESSSLVPRCCHADLVRRIRTLQPGLWIQALRSDKDTEELIFLSRTGDFPVEYALRRLNFSSGCEAERGFKSIYHIQRRRQCGTYVDLKIKLPNEDKVWTVQVDASGLSQAQDGPGIPYQSLLVDPGVIPPVTYQSIQIHVSA
ncbi:hypothetical protein K438DRAFT_1785324 [Mycena galopus ATCC 62051]|nr:hypothetical protein K438DRAFT_1785324 [Mycena galopus ATCC 62051]